MIFAFDVFCCWEHPFPSSVRTSVTEDLVDDNLINLLKEVVQVTLTENETWEERRNTSYQEGFSKGVSASMAFCTPQICDGTNPGIVEGQPKCPLYVQKALRRLAGLPEPPMPEPTLWERLMYRNACDYVQASHPGTESS
jgi:hypothetical protein